jgi:hypothetical protein
LSLDTRWEFRYPAAMLSILVAGGYDAADANVNDIRAFCAELGRAIIDQGHCLIGGCQTEFDKDIAQAAYERLNLVDPQGCEKRLISYILSGTIPIHNLGARRQSRLTSWDPGVGPTFVPEPVQAANAVILVRGFDGTFRAAHWSSIAKRPLLPLTSFGGAAAQIYREEFDAFDEKYSGRLPKNRYEELSTITNDWVDLANKVVALAEDVATSNYVSVIMSYATNGSIGVTLRNVYASFKQVCEGFEYVCERVEDRNTIGRIVPRILAQIRESAFVITDLTDLRPNVLFELGYAIALDKDVVITARKETELPFDVHDLPTIFWDPIDMLDLQERLKEKIELIAKKHGRV